MLVDICFIRMFKKLFMPITIDGDGVGLEGGGGESLDSGTDSSYDSTSSDQGSVMEESSQGEQALPENTETSSESITTKTKVDSSKSQEDFDYDKIPWDQIPEEMILERLGDRRFSRKINKEDREFSLRDSVDGFQLTEAARDNFQKASEMQKQSQGLLSYIKQNPVDAMNRLGVDFKQIAFDHLNSIAEEHELAQSNPSELRARQLEKQYQQMARENQQLKQAHEQKRFEAETAQQKQHFETSFKKTLQDLGLPVTQYNLQMLSREAMPFIKGGQEPPLSQIAQSVWGSTQKHNQSMFTNMESQKLIDYIGPDVMKKIRQADIAKARSDQSKKSSKQSSQQKQLKREPRTLDELNDMLFNDD